MIKLILEIICILMIALGILLFIRNEIVYNFRKKIIDKIFLSENWQEKLKEFDKVSYDEMVYKFWKPIKSFYPNIKVII